MVIVFLMIFFMMLFNMLQVSNKFKIIMMMFLSFFFFLLFNYFYMNMNLLYWMIHLDYYSYYLVLLSLWIMSLMLMYSLNYNFMKIYFMNMLIMTLSLIFTFLMCNYFMLYIFFEISVIPTLLLIMGWGGQYDRVEAGIYMLFYMLFFSLPLMMVLIYLYNLMFSLDMIILMNLNLINNVYLYMYMMLSFLVKVPMFMLHLWLPKAHVEAPITGSMILAGVMLKLGGYGVLRFVLLMEEFCLMYNYMIMSLSMIGSLLISLLCLSQIDMKMLVAYSSVIHMGMMISSIMTLSVVGYIGSLMMMISHGLCSSGLFCLVNIYYERSYSRSMLINKGMMNIIPSLGGVWFIMCIFNMAAPPSLNLFSEILMISSVMMYSSINFLILIFILFFSVVYMMYFYSSVQHGNSGKNINKFIMVSVWEFMLLLLHLLPLIYLILLF